MKSEKNVKRSAAARINRVIRESKQITAVAKRLHEIHSPDDMADLRNLSESLIQCVHEYNAYANVLLEKEDI